MAPFVECPLSAQHYTNTGILSIHLYVTLQDCVETVTHQDRIHYQAIFESCLKLVYVCIYEYVCHLHYNI